jgi:ATP-binding cassette subfamily F protein 2
MIDRGLIEAIDHEFDVKLDFPSCEKLAPPVLAFNMVSFSYSGDKANPLLKELEFGIDMDSRIVLVGPNGAGKSTLLKMIVDELSPTTGDIQRHGHLKVARYNQHSEEILDEEMNPLDWIMQQFPLPKTDPEEWRRRLGRYGVSGKRQVRPIGTLSDGQKTQLVFAWLAQQNPHMLLFDEPTNHLDMESIDSLADAINKFTGGMVLVSHDFRLLEKTAREIWVVEDKRITPWKGDIASYKKHLAKSFKAFE